MVLTFTGSLSVASPERSEVREMLVGAIGCNLAWGIVDAVMYVMVSVMLRPCHPPVEEGPDRPDPAEARAAIAGMLSAFAVSRLRPEISRWRGKIWRRSRMRRRVQPYHAR